MTLFERMRGVHKMSTIPRPGDPGYKPGQYDHAMTQARIDAGLKPPRKIFKISKMAVNKSRVADAIIDRELRLETVEFEGL